MTAAIVVQAVGAGCAAVGVWLLFGFGWFLLAAGVGVFGVGWLLEQHVRSNES